MASASTASVMAGSARLKYRWRPSLHDAGTLAATAPACPLASTARSPRERRGRSREAPRARQRDDGAWRGRARPRAPPRRQRLLHLLLTLTPRGYSHRRFGIFTEVSCPSRGARGTTGWRRLPEASSARSMPPGFSFLDRLARRSWSNVNPPRSTGPRSPRRRGRGPCLRMMRWRHRRGASSGPGSRARV